MIIFNKSSNALKVMDLLIHKLKVPVSFYTIERDLLEHPDYPSLLALSDCLTSWNVPNEATKIPVIADSLESLPVPFIAYIKLNDGQFILVEEITDRTIIFSDETQIKGSYRKNDFVENWDGIMLYAEKDIISGEPDYTQSLLKGWLNTARLPFLISITLMVITYKLNLKEFDLTYLLSLLLGFAGVSVSTLLLIHSVDASNSFVQNICSLGKKSNCSAILNSAAANVTSWLTWSEVGMFYFAGSFLCMLINPASSILISWLNILCIPYSFYSIGYQIKTKNWCILCCSVQAILWLQAVTFYASGISFKTDFSAINYTLIISTLLCFLTPIAIWAFIKPFFLKAGNVTPLKEQLKAFKTNGLLFNQMLSSQPNYPIADDLMPIVLGNPDAQTVITMVSNPFCGPCAETHKKLHEWLRQRDDIKLKILFTTANHDDEKHAKVAKHVIALNLYQNALKVEEALNNWYNQSNKNYESWAETYPAEFNNEIDIISEKQNEWCEMAEISFTPTIFINGYKLLAPYRLDDLKYLLV